MHQPVRPQKHPKNSDSDYKAEDQGSASDNPSWRKYYNPKRTAHNLKLSKKQMIENSIKTLIPIGTHLQYEEKPTNQEYMRLVHMGDNMEECKFCYRCFLGKVVEVLDGETVRVVGVVKGVQVKLTLRLNGVVAPDPRKSETKQFSSTIKKILTQMIQNKILRIQTGQYDKSGNLYSRLHAHTTSPIHRYQCQPQLPPSPPPSCLLVLSAHQRNSSQICINDFLIEHDMGRGRGRNQFSKKNYEEFLEKYQNKDWPVVENYPVEMWREWGFVGEERDEEQQE